MAGLFQRQFGGMRIARQSLNLGRDKAEFARECWAEGEHLRPMAHTEDLVGVTEQKYYRLVDGRNNGDGRIAIEDKDIVPVGFVAPDSGTAYFVRYKGELRIVNEAVLTSAPNTGPVVLNNGATQTTKVGWTDIDTWYNAIKASQATATPCGLAENKTVSTNGQEPLDAYPVGANGAPRVKNEVVFSYTVSKKLADNYWAETPPMPLKFGSVAFAPGHNVQVNNLIVPAEGADRMTVYATIGLNTRVWDTLDATYDPNITYTSAGNLFGDWHTGAEQTTQAYDPVPDDLVEAAILPNSIVAVAQKHRIFLSLPGVPHAYPIERTLVCEDEIRRIIPDQTGGIVLTDKGVYRINGDRLVLLADHMPLLTTGLSAVAATGTGLYFPSSEGWCQVFGNRVRLITEEREGQGSTVIPRHTWRIYAGYGIACACVLGRHLAYLQWNFNRSKASWWFLDLQTNDILYGRTLTASTEIPDIDTNNNHPVGLAYENGYWHYRFGGRRRFLELYGYWDDLPNKTGTGTLGVYRPQAVWRSGRQYQIGDTVPTMVQVSAEKYPLVIGVRTDDPVAYAGAGLVAGNYENDDFAYVEITGPEPVRLPPMARGVWWQYQAKFEYDVYSIDFAETIGELTHHGG